MTKRSAEASPRFKARVAGVCYLLGSLTSVFGQMVILGMLVVSGSATATAANILSHESLFRLVFFGFWCVLIGYLIFRSTFLPRIIGALEVLAGLGYLTLLWRPLAHYLYPYNLALAGPGEISLLLWLLVVGVNVERWKEQANAAAERQ